MSVKPLRCSLSAWSGLEGYCRLCNKLIPADRKKWCSGECLTLWRQQHRYFLARQLALKLSRRKCNCMRALGEPRHSFCASCGLCEAVVQLRGGIMTCDHIIPRQGDKNRFSCNNHQSNLQILCSPCHANKTKDDEIKYGI